MERKHEIKIRLSKEELDSLNLKVAKTNLSREEFCRLCFKEVAIKAKPSDDTHRLIYEIRKIGGNINALVVRAHIYKSVDTDAMRYELYNLHNLEKQVAKHYSNKKG
ncbi:MAG: hypothetical protein IKY90_08445 [Oscillospiraceae bacterium]|nr:hypothetical protein [Oscillospiraceae bacterium]